MLNTKTTLIALFSAAMLTAYGGGGGDGTAADAGTDGGEGTTKAGAVQLNATFSDQI